MSSKDKVGRNDPCPCGSGKKYKFCCGSGNSNVVDATDEFMKAAREDIARSAPDSWDGLTYMERRGTPNAATAYSKGLTAAIGDRVFSSKKEAEEFMESYAAGINSGALEDFCGLSPSVMHALLQGNTEELLGVMCVGIDVREADVKTVPILRRCLWLMRYVAEAGAVKLTQSGYLPPKIVMEWHDACIAIPGDTDRFKPRRECDSPAIMNALDILLTCGFLSSDGRMLTCDEGAMVLVEKRRWNDLYGILFLSALIVFREKEPLYLKELTEFENKVLPFGLYVLGKKARKELPVSVITETYDKAFPEIWKPLTSADPAMGYPFQLLLFAELLGLIPLTSIGKGFSETTVKVTGFYDRAIGWNV